MAGENALQFFGIQFTWQPDQVTARYSIATRSIREAERVAQAIRSKMWDHEAHEYFNPPV